MVDWVMCDMPGCPGHDRWLPGDRDCTQTGGNYYHIDEPTRLADMLETIPQEERREFLDEYKVIRDTKARILKSLYDNNGTSTTEEESNGL